MADEELKGMVVKLAMDSGSFNDGIQALNRQMKVVDSEFKTAVSGVDGFGDSLDGLKANIDRLSSSINIQSQVVEKYQTRLDASKKTLDGNVDAHNRLEQELRESQSAYEESARSLGKNADETIKFSKEVERLKKELSDNEQKIRNSQKAVDNQTVSVNKAQQKLNDYNRELNDTKSKLDNVSNQANKSSSIFDSFKSALGGSASETKVLGVSMGNLGGAFSKGGLAAGALGGVVAGLTSACIDLAMRGIQMALQAMSELAKQGIDTASSIQESANVINVVFKDDDITQWAGTVAGGFNLATDEAMKFSSTFGAVMTPTNLPTQTIEDMSIVLTKLSGDLSSLWNTTTEEAFNALRSGMTGEMESLKSFGVVMSEANLNAYAMSEGIGKTTKEMTEAEKALLRYNFILENTKIAQGDVSRSSDSHANSQRALQLAVKDASSSFGNELLPGLTMINQGMTEFIKENTGFITLLGNIFGVVVEIFGTLGTVVWKLKEPFVVIVDTISRVLNGMIDTLEIVCGEFGKYFGLMGKDAKDTGEDMGYYMQDFSTIAQDAMKETAKTTEEAFQDSAKAIKDELGIIGDALKEYYDDELKEYEKYLEEKNGKSKNGRIKTAKELEEMRKNYESQYNKDMAKEEEKVNRQLKVLKDQNDAVKQQTRVVEEESKKQISWIDKIGEAWKDAFKGSKAEEYKNSIGKMAGFATGTQYSPAGYAVVGEQGRELVQLPQGSKVINNNQTEQILNNTTSNSNPIVIQRLEVKSDNAEEFLNQLQMLVRRGALV